LRLLCVLCGKKTAETAKYRKKSRKGRKDFQFI